MQTPLSEEQIETALKSLDTAWSALPGEGLVRVFETGSFQAGLALLTRIAGLAEQQDHHPDAHLSYDQLELTLATHDVGGITEQDVALARAIDALE